MDTFLKLDSNNNLESETVVFVKKIGKTDFPADGKKAILSSQK